MNAFMIGVVITLFANLYGVSPEYAACVCQAESHYEVRAVGDGGRALGLWQWHVPAWTETRLAMGLDPDPALRADPTEATLTAMYAMGVEGRYDWWTTDCGCRELREAGDAP